MSAAPRYVRLAASLRAAIRQGVHPVGAYLPSEHELCARHRVSRHTAREALRILMEEGLIARRRGAGTIVTTPPPAPAFVQPLDGVDALLQYARDARLAVSAVAPLAAGDARRAALDLPEGAWTWIEGVRVAAGRPPVARAHIAVRADLSPDRETLAGLGGALTEAIAQAHGVVFEVIEQEIAAAALDADAARALEAAEGAPALRTRRRYLLSDGALAVASDTLHPADRFVYAMTLRRRASRGA